MKKIFYFIFLLALFIIGNKNVLAKEINYEGSTGVYVKKELGSFYESYNIRKYSKYNTKNYLYSIEPYTKNTFDAPYDILNEFIDVEERVKVLAYVGDKLFKEKNDSTYYGVAQVLIWQTLANEGKVNFNDENKYKNVIKEIEGEASNYLLKPFNGKDIEISLGEEFVINEELLNYYQIEDINSDLIDYKVENNKIIIKGLKVGKVTFKLKKFIKEKDYDMELFKSEDYTDYISAGNFYLEDSFTISVIGSQIKLEIMSDDENEFNVTYGIFDNDNNLLYKVDANKSGSYISCDLPLGSYKVKQLSISSNFLKDERVYEVLISSKEQQVLVLNNFRNKFKVTINFRNSEGELINSAIEFKIYDNYIADNGSIDIWLDKGSYNIELINSIYNLCDDINLEIDEDVAVDIVLIENNEVAIDVPDTISFNYLYTLLGFICVKKIIFN